ncbi:DJ-1/PfpI family protein [Candidatus Binatus sp.]|uniref:DJ-1/PfpI family protein n=1 Tax=Candidatus Binatus sp. TaxID=2811406 RepID=UPI003BB02F35
MKQTQLPLEIGMLLYPGLTLLDLFGPQTVFSWFANTHLVWKTNDPIVSDTGISVHPTATFETCPRELDILFVPGGFGQQKIMNDSEVLGFLADRASRSRYVTSVCSGSLLLGAAGLLKGYKATSHWSAREGLRMYGAEPVEARVVVDRNRVTGGGVTAGIDFGLVVLAKLRGDDAAKLTQLAMEYDPEPPFNAGSPAAAGPEIVEQAMSFMAAEMEKHTG